MPRKLVRVSKSLFERVEKSWEADAQAVDLPFEPWGIQLEHARKVVNEPVSDPKYGIYALAQVTNDGRIRAPFDRLVHVNHKLPKTSEEEIRFIWTQVSPSLAARLEDATVGSAMADYVVGAMQLAHDELQCAALRLYLPEVADQKAATLFARVWATMAENLDAERQTRVSKLQVKSVPQWLLIRKI